MNIILASASPRRKELMAAITKNYSVFAANADETVIEGELPTELVKRLARLKAQAVITSNESVVIGCDTIVELNGKILGKPENEREALEMLKGLSGNEHLVHTGVCILKGENVELFCETTKVFFGYIPQRELESYVKTDEPYDKAGGYGIQSWACKFIRKIEGCYFNVMGFPVSAVYERLVNLGVEV